MSIEFPFRLRSFGEQDRSTVLRATVTGMQATTKFSHRSVFPSKVFLSLDWCFFSLYRLETLPQLLQWQPDDYRSGLERDAHEHCRWPMTWWSAKPLSIISSRVLPPFWISIYTLVKIVEKKVINHMRLMVFPN
jgi:hypothetical protein